MAMMHSIDRGKYLKVGELGQTGVMTNGDRAHHARPKAMLRVGMGGGHPCHNEGFGDNP